MRVRADEVLGASGRPAVAGRLAAVGRLAGIALLLLGSATAAAADSSAVADRFLARAYLPSPQRVHGELRLLRRGDDLCMQTLIYSDSLRRGVDRIRKKELYHWPAGRPGAEDSARYLAGLEQAKRHVLERFGPRADLDDARQRMLIEFVLGKDKAQVAFYDVDVERSAGGFVVSDRKPILVLDASTAYVGRAIRIQGEEGFDPPPPELSTLPK